MNNQQKKNERKPRAPKAKKGNNAPKGAKVGARQAEGIRIGAPTKKMGVVQIRQVQQQKVMKRTFNMGAKAGAFFTSATDPMHDSSVANTGWPDRNIELSVVRKIRQTMSLTRPAITNPHFADGDGWDCHVIFNPWLNSMTFGQHDRVNNTLIEASNIATAHIGGLQAYGAPIGSTFVYGSDDPASGNFPIINSLQLDAEMSQGVGRVVGLGIEATNTSAQLFQQGHVYCWRAPEPALQPATYSYERAPDSPSPAIPVASFPFTGQVYRYPPGNVAQAQYYTGTADWKAVEGAYMVGTFHDFENPAQMVNYTQPMLIDVINGEDKTYNEPGTFGSNTSSVWVPTTVSGGTAHPTYHGHPGTKIYPLNQMGMIFSGLGYESTLDVELVIYYESFPSLAQASILTLANPSTPYNERVLKLLAAVMRSMPVATMQKNNASGDWWDKILEALQFVAPGVLTAFGGEILAPGAFSALTAIRSYRNR